MFAIPRLSSVYRYIRLAVVAKIPIERYTAQYRDTILCTGIEIDTAIPPTLAIVCNPKVLRMNYYYFQDREFHDFACRSILLGNNRNFSGAEIECQPSDGAYNCNMFLLNFRYI